MPYPTHEQLAETVREILPRRSGDYYTPVAHLRCTTQEVDDVLVALSKLVRLAEEADTLRRDLEMANSFRRAAEREAEAVEAERDRLRITGNELLARLHFVPNLPANVEEAAEAFYAALDAASGETE